MEIINELELRRILKKRLSGNKVNASLAKRCVDENLPWEERLAFWHFLYRSGRRRLLVNALVQSLKSKTRVPYDLYIQICADGKIKPESLVIAALLKGVRKQKAFSDLVVPRAWDRFDERIGKIREKLLSKKTGEQRKFKDGLLEKFEFLKSQRMTDQAGRVLRRMVELYPDDQDFLKLKAEFEERWAREVLATHMAGLSNEKLDRTLTAPSTTDEEMLKCFAKEGEKICMQHREFATDLAIAFWFMEDYQRALESLAWAPPEASNDWMRAELLFLSRRFIECIELLNQIEIKQANDPESTFAASYLRAQCLHACGQQPAALEILQSIVRVRPNYRSATALIQQWTEGAGWE